MREERGGTGVHPTRRTGHCTATWGTESLHGHLFTSPAWFPLLEEEEVWENRGGWCVARKGSVLAKGQVLGGATGRLRDRQTTSGRGQWREGDTVPAFLYRCSCRPEGESRSPRAQPRTALPRALSMSTGSLTQWSFLVSPSLLLPVSEPLGPSGGIYLLALHASDPTG